MHAVEPHACMHVNLQGQLDAKRAVAVALRNRWRRMQLPGLVRDEIIPK